jgi:membrane protein implicated in regulation of membrane protease activity
MEIFWLSLGVVTLIAVLYLNFTQGTEKYAFYFVFPLIAFMAYLGRRFMRKRMEKTIRMKEEQKKGK